MAEEGIAEIGLTLGNLLANDEPLVWVLPSASLEEAVTTTRLNDFSQLAVLASPYKLHGAVSWIRSSPSMWPSAVFSWT